MTTVQPLASAASSALSSLPIFDWRSYAYSRTSSVWRTINASRGPLPAAVYCSICRSPSELPNAASGRWPIAR